MLERRTPLKRTAMKPRNVQAIARDLSERREELAARREERMKALIAGAPRTRRGVISQVSSTVKAVPKEPRERCDHLLAMAEGKPCLFWFVAGCRGGDGSTTVHAHDNRLSAGKGKGYKAHDWRGVQACEPCHTAFDQGKAHTREQKNSAFDAAYERQLAAWRDIANSPTARQKDREAARWAINRHELKRLKGEQG